MSDFIVSRLEHCNYSRKFSRYAWKLCRPVSGVCGIGFLESRQFAYSSLAFPHWAKPRDISLNIIQALRCLRESLFSLHIIHSGIFFLEDL